MLLHKQMSNINFFFFFFFFWEIQCYNYFLISVPSFHKLGSSLPCNARINQKFYVKEKLFYKLSSLKTLLEA